MSFSAQFVKGFVDKIFPILRKTQRINLAFGILGQIKSQSGLMSEIVRDVPGAKKHKHRLKRFWRFLSNHLIKPENLRLFWISWCVKTFNYDLVIKVAMDWTTLPGNIQCLMICIPFKGRAIPLIWHLVKYCDIKDSQNLIEERLVARLFTIVNEVFSDKKLLLTADRGFGRATLFKFLLKKKMLFAIRVKGDVTITTKNGKRMSLRTLEKRLTVNTPQWYTNISYRSDGIVTGLNLAAVVAPENDDKKEKDPDPWFIVTNLRKSKTTIQRYAERFHIEEWFKDFKHQLGIDKLQTRNLKRVRRLVLVSTVSYGIIMLVGKTAEKLTNLQDMLITGGKKSASRIWFALKIIKHKLCGKTFWRKVYQQATAP